MIGAGLVVSEFPMGKLDVDYQITCGLPAERVASMVGMISSSKHGSFNVVRLLLLQP